MMSLRNQIRHALIAQLKQGNVLEGKIFDTPIHTFDPAQLPLLIVSVEKDQVLTDWTSILMTTLASNALIQLHELSFHLKILLKSHEQMADEFENIVSHITESILIDRTLEGLCKDIRLHDLAEITLSEESEQLVSTMTLPCSVLYRTVDNLPGRPFL